MKYLSGHRILFFDIEVAATNGFPEPDKAEEQITAIANYDQANDRWIVFVLDPEGLVTDSRNENKEIVSCQTEDELIEQWMEFYDNLKPTILVGWNSDGFDIPYMYNRLKRVKGVKFANRLSPINIVKFNERMMRFEIAGVSSIDYYPLYEKYTAPEGKKPSYRLDAIGQAEVKLGKVEYEGTLDNLYRTDLHKFIEYNFRDVEILVQLEKHRKFIALAQAICHAGHVPYDCATVSSRFIEGTILVYLHRLGIIAPNKPEGGREAYEEKQESDEEGFTGAYVKSPYPGLYEWVYSLDLQSLYPSIIMSLNISPETKIGRITNWNPELYAKKQLTEFLVELNGVTTRYDLPKFMDLMQTCGFQISSNGILYSTEKEGILPTILNNWFNKRKEYKDLMFKYEAEQNKELSDYYNQMQAVQKVFLNSVYGVIGMASFRFYDLDNALAVTATGQDVIKTTSKYVNNVYKKHGVPKKTDTWIVKYWDILKTWARKHKEPIPEKPSNEDYCVYIDTDSVYYSADDIMNTWPLPILDKKEFTIGWARRMEKELNDFYDTMARRLFFCNEHRFVIKGESVVETGLWIAKKRYALKKVYDLEKHMDVNKLTVKGLDMVRSTFAPAFAAFTKEMTNIIVNKGTKPQVDKMILDFHEQLSHRPAITIMRNTGASKIAQFDDPSALSFVDFDKGVPAHYKAALTYNRFLRKKGLDKKYPPISKGDKIKWTYLKRNPYMIDSIAVKGYDDPPEILELVETYIDHERVFESDLKNKLSAYYEALEWGLIPTEINQSAFEFFTWS
jgi:DNA polymerase elongation subunit (family B)